MGVWVCTFMYNKATDYSVSACGQFLRFFPQNYRLNRSPKSQSRMPEMTLWGRGGLAGRWTYTPQAIVGWRRQNHCIRTPKRTEQVTGAGQTLTPYPQTPPGFEPLTEAKGAQLAWQTTTRFRATPLDRPILSHLSEVALKRTRNFFLPT